METMTLLEAHGVSKSFRIRGRKESVEALRDVDFHVSYGEIVGLVGPNGAGKSTLLLIFAGMLAADQGEITFAGRRVRVCGVQDIGYAPERSALHTALTLRETLQYLGGVHGWARERAESAADRAIASVKLEDRADKPVTTLSRGMGQRLALAQALLGEPKLLILDETLSGVDPVVHRDLTGLLVKLAAGGTSVILSSHDLTAVERVSTRVVVLLEGTVRASVDAGELKGEAGLERRFFDLVDRAENRPPS